MNNNAVVGAIVLALIVLAGWFAYQQGYFQGAADNEQDIEIDLPGGSPTPQRGY